MSVPSGSRDKTEEAEQLHEYIVDQLGYSTYDVDVAVTDDGTLEATVAPGAASPADDDEQMPITDWLA